MTAHPTAAAAPAVADEVAPGTRGRLRNPVTWVLTALVDLYRLTAPLRQPRCRFHPTCSTYARRALVTHGALRGLYLTVRRLLRCHPWNPGGVDHVPPKAENV